MCKDLLKIKWALLPGANHSKEMWINRDITNMVRNSCTKIQIYSYTRDCTIYKNYSATFSSSLWYPSLRSVSGIAGNGLHPPSWPHSVVLWFALTVLIASSTDVERAFSRGGLVVSKRRHALSDESTRAAAVFESWVAKGGIVPDKKILKNLANKAKRKRGEANLTDNSESELEPQSGSESDSVVVTTPVIVVE